MCGAAIGLIVVFTSVGSGVLLALLLVQLGKSPGEIVDTCLTYGFTVTLVSSFFMVAWAT